jgi:hypothetical protein
MLIKGFNSSFFFLIELKGFLISLNIAESGGISFLTCAISFSITKVGILLEISLVIFV